MDKKKRLKFFIIDDDPDAIGFMTEVLKAEGHSVFSNCAAAYSLFEILQQKPDCVLAGLAMAEMDGLELCKELRSKQSLRNIKIIVVSADGDETWRKRAREFGADGYIAKPLDAQTFVRQVDLVIEESGRS